MRRLWLILHHMTENKLVKEEFPAKERSIFFTVVVQNIADIWKALTILSGRSTGYNSFVCVISLK